MRCLIGTIAALMFTTVARADDATFFNLLRRTTNIEASAEALAIHVACMVQCRLDGLMKPEDVELFRSAFLKADEDAFRRGSTKGVRVAQSLPLKPGSDYCALVKLKIEEALPDYDKLAATLRSAGVR